MDILVLQGAIASLCGVIAVIAKAAWSERFSRIQSCEVQLAFYKEQVVPTLTRVLDTLEKQHDSQERLTTVIEERMKRNGDRNV